MTLTDHDEAVEQRLREALRQIAADYRSPASGPAVPGGTRRLRRHLSASRGVATAAAVIALLGGGGAWYASARPHDPPRAVSSPTPAQPAAFGDDFVVPEPAPMRWQVRVDDSLELDELVTPNRFRIWLTESEPLTTRWFVELTGARATAMLTVDDYPSWMWERYEGWGPFGEVDGLAGARFDPDTNAVAWQHDAAVRVVRASGDGVEGLTALVATVAQLDDLAELEVPGGYGELTYHRFTGWQVAASGWSFGVLVPEPDEVDEVLATWGLAPEDQPIEQGWLRSTATGWRATVRVGSFIVSVGAPDEVGEDVMRTIATRLEVVPSSSASEEPFELDGSVLQADPVAGGELPWGRWLAFEDGDDRTDRDAHCLVFVGAVDLSGCTDVGSDQLTLCRVVFERPARIAMVTTAEIGGAARPVTVDVSGDVLPTTIEASGGLTFVLAETAHARIPTTFTNALGDELCRRPSA